MKRSVKAALLSGLVFPGLGQLVLRRPLRGAAFLLPMALAVVYLLRRVLQLADTILTDLNSGALPFDPVAIAERVHASGGDDLSITLASWLCLLCWIGSVADALWFGPHDSSPP